MKKLLIFYCLITPFLLSAQLITNADNSYKDKDGVISKIKYCDFTIEVIITHSNSNKQMGAVNVDEDCIGKYNYSINLKRDCEGSSSDCRYVKGQLYFNGIYIEDIDDLSDGIIKEGKVEDLPGAEFFGFPAFQTFQLVINTTCRIIVFNPFGTSTMIEREQPPFTIGAGFQTAETGGQYYTVIVDENQINFGDEAICGPAIEGIPCGFQGFLEEDSNSKIVYEYSTSTTTSSQLNFSAKISVDTEKANMFKNVLNLPIDLDLSLGYTNSYGISKVAKTLIGNERKSSRKLRLKGSDGKIIGFGWVIAYYALIEDLWEAGCDGYDQKVGPSTVRWIPFAIAPKPCEFELPDPNDCDPYIVPKKEFGVDGNNFNSGSACNGWIKVSLEQANTNEHYIFWEGPSEFFSDSWELNELELGIYKYQVLNQCCDRVEGSIELCPFKNEGPWVLQENNWTYCKEVICSNSPGSSALKSADDISCTTTSLVCVEPDHTEINYVNTDCVETRFYQGEELGDVVSDTKTEEIFYNNGTCVKITYCDGGVVDEQSQKNTFGPWQFNAEANLCERAIVCFDQHMGEIDAENSHQPTVNTSYSHKDCKREIVCGGFVISTETEKPVFGDGWSFNVEEEECERVVFCFDELMDEIDTEDAEIEEEYDIDNNVCIRTATCDDQEYELEDEEPHDESEWEVDDEECLKTIQCTENSEDIELVFDWELEEDWTFEDDLCWRTVLCAEEEIEITENPIFEDWSYDEGNQNCSASVFCDGNEVGKVTYEAEVGEWELTSSTECERINICAGIEYVETTNEVTRQQNVYCDGFYGYYILCEGEIVECRPYYPRPSTTIPGHSPNGKVNLIDSTALYGIFIANNEVNASPNPFTHSTSILGLSASASYQIEIYDLMQGLKYTEEDYKPAEILQLDVLEKGIYVMRILQGNELIHIQKLIKID